MAQLLRARDLSARLSVPLSTVYHWSSSGQLPCLRFGRLVRFDEGDVAVWLAAHQVKAAEQGEQAVGGDDVE